MLIATPSPAFAPDEVAAAARSGELMCCDSCRRAPAVLVMTYPDTRFRLCTGCVPSEALAVVEPLDLDDPLACDPHERQDRDGRW